MAKKEKKSSEHGGKKNQQSLIRSIQFSISKLFDPN